MLTAQDLHQYQKFGANYICEKPACAMFLDMGLGKTITTLTAISHLTAHKAVKKTLIVAPKRIAETVWDAEILNWQHVCHLKISKVIGSVKQRKAALMRPADIYIIGRDNVAWLVALLQSSWCFDMLVIDESSSFKSNKAVKFDALTVVRPPHKSCSTALRYACSKWIDGPLGAILLIG